MNRRLIRRYKHADAALYTQSHQSPKSEASHEPEQVPMLADQNQVETPTIRLVFDWLAQLSGAAENEAELEEQWGSFETGKRGW